MTACAPTLDAELRARLGAAATKAQERCYKLIHDDTYAYARCLRGLLDAEPNPTPERLGIEYFAAVGALNSARMGMRGAEDTARDFIGRYEKTRRVLGLDEREVCASVPGDCDVRLAQMRQVAVSPAPHRGGEDDGDGHRH
jgi:hypothetical protein